MQSKAELRERFLKERRSIPEDEKAAADSEITRRVLQHPWFQRAETVFVYYSTDDEISTHELIKACWALGKRVCVPKCLPKRQMEARCITSFDELTEQTFGIPEPGSACEVIAPDDIDLCLVPALSCDRRGYRLGYGGGFYDMFLPKTGGNTLALCAADRIVDRLPTEETDVRCGGIVTEREVIVP